MKDRLQEGTAELFPDIAATAADEALPIAREPEPLSSARQALSWLRLAYSFEFLFALLTILTLWSEVGGQSHLDMMPWYTKLICLIASAWCCVRFTAGLVEERNAWNRRTVGWLLALILVAVAMGAITYYYHLHEDTDGPDSVDATSTAMNFTKFPTAPQPE